MTGIARINDGSRARGYFFIRGQDGQDYYAHCKELRGGLIVEHIREGQRLRFVATSAYGRGLKANEIYPE